MDTLVHICCGPCATQTVEHFRERGHSVSGFFFNPNIHPFLEFKRRLTGVEDLLRHQELPLRVDGSYDPAQWFESVGRHGSGRCRRCVGQRLRRTAQEAREQGFAAFSTSLAISPWQDHEAIVGEGARAGAEFEVEFLYEDLRPRYQASRRSARELGLYRQKYCGCLLSEWERYR
ncbi:MAG: epoxyqueuosine reductase QueH [Thermoleophilia bacterium]